MTANFKLAEGAAAPVLARMWSTLLLKGVAVILFGVVAFFWLGDSVAGLTRLFAA